MNYNLFLPDEATMYEALVNKDSKFEGIFYVGIKTTGIFCRPTCRARKPKKENVEYFNSVKECIDLGYRPCKLCRPLELNGSTPDFLKDLLMEIEENPALKIKDADLRKRDIEPARVCRWFKKNHGITFQAYLRSMRINAAFGRIRNGEKVIESAFESGYDSLSGFTDFFKKTTGFAPSESTDKRIITVTRILTPLGPMLAAVTDKGICLLEFTDRRMLETQIKTLHKLFKAAFVPGKHKLFDQLEKELKEYFDRKRKEFEVTLDVPGTDFQMKVWDELQRIPYGEIRSYKEQAIALGNLKAIRAVARANGENRIAIIIPCHRVIGSNGEMVGYGGGVWRKQHLLQLESTDFGLKS